MEKRRFGRTGHMSTVAILGTFAFSKADQAQADKVFELALKHGVNHIDVAPSYFNAEQRCKPWMQSHRQDFFVGCKTTERKGRKAKKEMLRSLKRVGVEYFDLYQLHAVNDLENLDKATKKGGVLEAIQEAKKEGLTNFIGITSHGFKAPAVLLEALKRYDFDSVLFPLNFVQYAIPEYKQNTDELLQQCKEKDAGVMIIKSISKGPWGERKQIYNTWYEPFEIEQDIQDSVSFVLSQHVTGICTVGDMELLPKVLNACTQFKPLNKKEQHTMIKKAQQFQPLFPKI